MKAFKKIWVVGLVSMISLQAVGQTCSKTSSGANANTRDWGVNGNWSCGVSPKGAYSGTHIVLEFDTDIDEIIDLSSSTTLVEVRIKAGVQLAFYSNGKLILPPNAVIILEEGASVYSQGNTPGTLISIGGNDIWGKSCEDEGCDNSTLTGPGEMNKDSQPGAPLPISLISFNAKQAANQVEIAWVTGSEENTSHFVVERSADGRSFQGVGTIKAQGWSSEALSYQWVDACPLEGRAYYRLRAVDYDQHTEFFGMERVDFSGKSCEKVSIFPNPVVDHRITVNLNMNIQENASLTLKNSQGRVVYAQNIKESGSEYQLPTSIPTGVYIVEVQSGSERHLSRVLVR
jgi:hypothetical protein